MAEKKSRRATDASQMSGALARWDEEGGAPSMVWSLRDDAGRLTDPERRILENLGAALVGEWSNLPTDIQKAIFRRATTDKAPDPKELKAQVARFLHDHKRDSAAP